MNPIEEQLRNEVLNQRVVVVVGSGVSRSTNAQAPEWRALLLAGLERCQLAGAPEKWCQRVTTLLEPDAELDLLLNAAESIQQKLVEVGQFATWLRKTFNNLQPVHRDVIKAIHALQLPILTTNYDGLIEAVTGDRPVTWQDRSVVSRVARGEERRIVHLHGHWEEPDSIVLGLRSYDRVRNDDHTQAVMKAFGVMKSFLFIGCGDEGLLDPNFGTFLKWLKRHDETARVEHSHYRLVRKKDVKPLDGGLVTLPYGKDYPDLPAFLTRLIPPSAGPASTPIVVPHVPAPRSPAVAAYLNRLADSTSTIELLGLGRSLQIRLPISEAYVPLEAHLARALSERPTERADSLLAEAARTVELREVFATAARLKERGVVLLGEPGAGKTTGARQLAWCLASGTTRPQDLQLPSQLIPVLLRFRNLTPEMLAGEFTLKPLLLAETHCPDAPNALQDPGEELWNGTGLLWILDGLDEVVDPEARRKVSQAVQRALKNRTADWFLVTCRFAGYFRNEVPLGDRFVEFHVRPLSDDQVRRFVNDWFAAAYPKLIPEAGEAQRRAKRDSEDLLEILARPAYQAGRLRELCTNPLLLTILCVVFQEERKLPTGRADLYDHCVRVLLEHWRKDVYTSGLGTRVAPYDGKVARAVLARVAWWMHGVNDRSAVGVDDLIAQAAEGLVGASPEAGLGLDGTRFVERMRDESGMLALSPGGQIGFLHLTFQEYLAAEYVATEGLVQAGMIRQLAERAHEGWWREVTLLSLRYTRAFNEAFFRELLAAGMAESQTDLAEDCLREAAHFTPEPFLEVLRNPAAPAPRVAGVLRLLRERAAQVPGLVSEATRLVDSPDAAIRGFAREIVAREGGVLEAVLVPGEVATSVVNADVQVDATSGVTFLRIPKGRFWMGGDRFEDESPRHQVEIAQDFWLGKYPVTNEQYRRFLDSPGCRVKRPAYFDDRRFNQPEQPVVGVSWSEAAAFCAWVGGRLPTETEWEYACRAGTETEYWFGDAEKQLQDYGWYERNSGGQSHPVGAKPANPWGLHDMHGNVWEWCEDWFAESAYRERIERALVKQQRLSRKELADLSPTKLLELMRDASVPLDAGPAAGSSRVLRGGSWLYFASACRSACRRRDAPELRYSIIGFRVCRGGESEVARRPRD